MIKAITLSVTILCSLGKISTVKEWDHYITLDSDGKYHLSWTFTKEEIKFKAEVQTKGYVGFGLSMNGAMAGSDIVTGWVNNGKAYFQDRYGIGNKLPAVDTRQDWTLIEGMENDTHTVLLFRRMLDTCDKHDIKVDSSTMRLIYAYCDYDPIENELSAIPYHGPRRGVKSAILLQPETQTVKPDDSLLYWDVSSPNYTLTGETSMYWCKIHKTPDVKQKHHIVRIEPLITEGNEQFVHHMLMYECLGDQDDYERHVNDEYEISRGHQCRHPNMPDEMWKCEGVFFAWGVGGNALDFPKYVGLPLEPSKYYMLEIHYDNQKALKGITDQSGLRLHYTPLLREQDAGTLMIGSTVSPRMFIPPGREEYVITGHSNPECLKSAMSKSGVKALGVLLHSHLIGRRLKARHFRKNIELPPLAEDMNYDFNYQEYRLMPEEVKILPEDQLSVECTYNSSRRKFTTFGGENTVDEMCLAFILHYPRIERFASASVPSVSIINEELGTTLSYKDISSNVWYTTLRDYDWSNINITQLEATMRDSPHDTHCYLGDGNKSSVKSSIGYPHNLKPYKNTELCQDKVGKEMKKEGNGGQTTSRNNGNQNHDWMAKYISLFSSAINLLYLKTIQQK